MENNLKKELKELQKETGVSEADLFSVLKEIKLIVADIKLVTERLTKDREKA